ncbi:hypothetical protein UPYG_G00001820 [Umbra pygmaea]|uniref:Uncharacterized protein n=1 Tax=Umbra pygmaea TaxID=75934 RepID=A0ABD0XGI7_UMBPY
MLFLRSRILHYITSLVKTGELLIKKTNGLSDHPVTGRVGLRCNKPSYCNHLLCLLACCSSLLILAIMLDRK